jgi:hypothetical protein
MAKRDWGQYRQGPMSKRMGLKPPRKYEHQSSTPVHGPGSRSQTRDNVVQGILYSRRDMRAGGKGMIPFNRGAGWFAGSVRAMSSAARRGRPVGIKSGFRSVTGAALGPDPFGRKSVIAPAARSIGTFRGRGAAGWSEAKHPRGFGGKFRKK